MPRKQHDFTATEIKAGLFLLAALAIFAMFVGVVTNRLPRVTGKTYICYFQDTGGLDAGADVRFGGYKVGKVNAIGLDPQDQSRIRVEITVDNTVPVNADSEVSITSVTLTSARHVEIKTGSMLAALLEPGSVIPAKDGGLFSAMDTIAMSVADLLEDIQTLFGVEELELAAQEAEASGTAEPEEITTVTDLLKGIEVTLNEGEGLVADLRGVVGDHRPDIDLLFEQITEVADGAKDIVASVEEIIGENREGLRTTVDNIAVATDDLGPIMEDARQLAGRIDALADALQKTLDFASVMSEDAAGLLGDNRSAMDDMVHELSEAVRYLKLFARTLAEQPQSLLVGKGN